MNNFSYEFFPKIIVLTLCIFSKIACAEINLNIPNTDQFKLSKTSSIQDYKLQTDDSYKLSNRPLTNKKISDINKKLPFDKEVLSAAQETQMEPALIHAIMTVESNYNLHAQSKRGAYGLMQLMPETARRFKVLDRRDPKQNILAGAKYLRELLNLYKGDLKLAIAAYNAGPAAVQKYSGKIPPYKETMEYVPKVMKYYRQYS
jgi:soluble lytic murein transglycosylase-like protein